ncbi:MAG: YceI family protein, partial [Bacteroidia bacterium]|nr:YceI family protein [Bacteroidia bacterium]
LTIRDVTKQIEVPFNYDGEIESPYGFKVYTFSGALNLKGSEYNVAPSLGAPLVADEVKVNFSVETAQPQVAQ